MLRKLVARLSRERTRRWCLLAQDHLVRGELDRAREYCVKSLSAQPLMDDALSLLAKALMPGDDYFQVLSRLHEWLKPQSYLEIGVSHGDSLALAKPGVRAVGIDPCPQIQAAIRSRARLYPIPSDDFFSNYDLLRELDAPRLALAFIDGLHVFEQALRDFIHVERYADAGTVVLIHDCLPVARQMAARERCTGYWCGDIWKLAVCLAKYRPDLSFQVVPTYPSGLAVVTRLNPRSTVLQDRLEAIVAEYRDQSFPYEYLDRDSLPIAVPNVIPNDWEHISRAVSGTTSMD